MIYILFQRNIIKTTRDKKVGNVKRQMGESFLLSHTKHCLTKSNDLIGATFIYKILNMFLWIAKNLASELLFAQLPQLPSYQITQSKPSTYQSPPFNHPPQRPFINIQFPCGCHPLPIIAD